MAFKSNIPDEVQWSILRTYAKDRDQGLIIDFQQKWKDDELIIHVTPLGYVPFITTEIGFTKHD